MKLNLSSEQHRLIDKGLEIADGLQSSELEKELKNAFGDNSLVINCVLSILKVSSNIGVKDLADMVKSCFIEPAPLQKNQIIEEKYLIEEMLGEGGMGSVYKVTHLQIGRECALKIIKPINANDQNFIKRFEREAKLLGRLRNPNIVNITDSGVTEINNIQVPYIVMEYLDGKNLASYLKEKGALSLKEVTDFVRQICYGLAHAHNNGVIHRDLKPSNIWLESLADGTSLIKILDFGLAKLVGNTEIEPLEKHSPSAEEHILENLTKPGQTPGTPTYMSPEQWEGGEIDTRTDVYSLGVIVYQLLTGKPLFEGSYSEIKGKHLEELPAGLRNKAPHIPKKVEELIYLALSKNKTDRPTIEQFSEAFQIRAEGSEKIIIDTIQTINLHWRSILMPSSICFIPILLITFCDVLFPLFGINSARKLNDSFFSSESYWYFVSTFLEGISFISFSRLVIPVIVELNVFPTRKRGIRDYYSTFKSGFKLNAINKLSFFVVGILFNPFFLIRIINMVCIGIFSFKEFFFLCLTILINNDFFIILASLINYFSSRQSLMATLLLVGTIFMVH